MYDLMKRHEVQVLKKAGHSYSEIAEHVGISRRAVITIANEPPVEKALRCRGRAKVGKVGRPRVATAFGSKVQELFEKEPDLPTVEVLRRMRLEGYRAGKSALYELVAELRPRRVEPVVRFEGVPGEFSQHDFGQVVVKYVDGQTEKIRFFASRLKWSRWSEVSVVPDEQLETLVRALLDHLAAWGGVPLVCVFDNPKTIVLRHEGPIIEWNATFAQVAIDQRFAVELCTPARGQEKGSVENLVKWVKNSFFKVRRFHDREDLLRQLREWLAEINTQRPNRASKAIPAARLIEEKERLRSLPIAPEKYALRVPVVAGPTGHVSYDGVRYSMPARAMGVPGTLFLFKDRVRIVAGRFSADHPRKPQTPGVSWAPEHRAEMLAAVSGQRGQLYLKRQQLCELGEVMVDFITEVVHKYPRTWKPDVEKLYDLLVRFGPVPLLRAVQCAAQQHLYGADHVARVIKETA